MRNTGSEFQSESIWNPLYHKITCLLPTQRALTLTFKCTAVTPRVPVPSLCLIMHSPHVVGLIRIGLWVGAAILLRQLDATQPTLTVSLVSII